jgi:hypothetical protein
MKFHISPYFPKKHCLGPQNGSRSEKLLKIVNYQNCEKNVLSQLEKVGGHRYPPGSLFHMMIGHKFKGIRCKPLEVCMFLTFLSKTHV